MKQLTLIFFFTLSGFMQAQSKTIKVSNLNHDFPELINENFDVINSTKITDSLGITYLIFKIVPKQQGLYFIIHNFSDTENANNKPTIEEKYNTEKNIKEINYESKYILPIYKETRQQFYKYKSVYTNTNSTLAHNSINDTISIPFIINKNYTLQEITIRKFKHQHQWDKEGNEMISKKDTIEINYVNTIEALEFIHFKHFWTTQFHVIREGTQGFSSIYAVFKAKKKGDFTVKIGREVIPLKIVSKSTPLETYYGISCERKQINYNGGGVTSTFKKKINQKKVLLREGDIIYFIVEKIPSQNGIVPEMGTLIFENKS